MANHTDLLNVLSPLLESFTGTREAERTLWLLEVLFKDLFHWTVTP
jgi:hypothetical protein